MNFADRPQGIRRLAIILSADICGYSVIAEKDDGQALEAVTVIASALKAATTKYGGRVFHEAGDGFLSEFPSILNGVKAAIDFQKQIASSAEIDAGTPQARVGIHVGDVFAQNNGDMLGHGVNVASHLQSAAAPGEILVSAQAIGLLHDKLKHAAVKRGPMYLKNMDEPVIAYEIDFRHNFEAPRIQQIFTWLKKVWRRYLLRALPILIMLLVTALSVDSFVQRQENQRLAGKAETDRQLAESEVNALTDAIGLTQPFAQQSQIVAVRAVAESLARSEILDKKLAIELIEAGKVSEAATLLSLLFEEQKRENQPVSILSETLREVAALTFYSEKNRAIDAYQKLIDLSGGTDNESQLRLGALYLEASQLDDAYDIFNAVLNSAADPHQTIHATIGIARFQLRRRQFNEANRLLLKALALSEQHNFPVEKSRTLLFLKVPALDKQNFELAEKYLREALAIELSLPANLRNEHRISEIHFNIGSTLSSAGRNDDAIIALQAALRISERLRDRRTTVRSLYNLGYVMYLEKRYLDAEKTLNRTLSAIGDEKMNNIKSLTFLALAQIAQEQGNTEKYCAIIEQAKLFYARTPDIANDATEKLLDTNDC